MIEIDEDDSTFLEKHGGKVVFGVLALMAGGGALWWFNREPEKPRPKPAAMVNITPILPPPPPPPPPPPKEPEPQPEPEQIEEEQAFEPEVAEEPSPEPDSGPEPIGTGITGDGPPDGFGLSNKGGGGGIGGRIGGIGGGGKYGGYAAKVQAAVSNAMRQNSKTRSAVLSVEVKIWADPLGRVTRAQLGRSTGDAELDRAVRDEVLGKLRLPEPPPSEMPMPINLRLTARKP